MAQAVFPKNLREIWLGISRQEQVYDWGKLNEKPILKSQTKFVKRKVECTVLWLLNAL